MIRALFIALALTLALVGPAEAHKLKVFAAVEGNHVGGYGFFIGGGRAQGTEWSATTPDGTVIAKGRTDEQGTFGFDLTTPPDADISVVLNTEEGHIAETVLAASRFAGDAAETAAADSSGSAAAVDATPAAAGAAPPAAASSADIEAAVQRQIEPLLERIEQMDARMRFTDVVSGLFLIIGLAGILLWVRSRGRK